MRRISLNIPQTPEKSNINRSPVYVSQKEEGVEWLAGQIVAGQPGLVEEKNMQERKNRSKYTPGGKTTKGGNHGFVNSKPRRKCYHNIFLSHQFRRHRIDKWGTDRIDQSFPFHSIQIFWYDYAQRRGSLIVSFP